MIALLTGLVAALCFPTVWQGHRLPGLGWMVWLCLIPLCRPLSKASVARGFGTGFLFGLSFYGVTLYWIFIALHRYGSIPVLGASLGLLVAVLILAVGLALMTGLVAWLYQRGFSFWLVFPVAWVVHDFALNFFPFGGFPWSQLAYTQAAYLPLIQSLDLFGVYGLTFLIVMVNAVLAQGLRIRGALILVGCLFILNLGYGFFRVRQVERQEALLPTMKMALIQGNIPQDEKWLLELGDEALARHLSYTQQASESKPESGKPESGKPDLIVWPEAAYPFPVSTEIRLVPGLETLSVPLLTGAVTFEGGYDWSFRLFNSALLVGPGGKNQAVYHKQHLVPFGEYVPLERVLYFLNKIVPAATSFTPGSTANLLPISGPGGSVHRAGVTVCYEDIFPAIARRFARHGADFLVNLTNGGWYDRSSMLFQHVDYSRYRAIENRRAMVRSTNTGITTLIGPSGRTLAALPPFTEGVLQVEVPVGKIHAWYTSWGDWFAWGCVLVMGLILLPLPCREGMKGR